MIIKNIKPKQSIHKKRKRKMDAIVRIWVLIVWREGKE